MLNLQTALGDLKTLALTRRLPGAFATQILADMGADVLKVEQPGAAGHRGGPDRRDAKPGAER